MPLIFRTFLHIAYGKHYEQETESAHIQPLKPNAWIVICVWIIISELCLLLIMYLNRLFEVKQKAFIISDYLLTTFESFTNQCGNDIPNDAPVRMSILMTRSIALIIISVYSATILSFVTVKRLHYPFRDIEGLFKDGTFGIGYESGTFAGRFLMV